MFVLKGQFPLQSQITHFFYFDVSCSVLDEGEQMERFLSYLSLKEK